MPQAHSYDTGLSAQSIKRQRPISYPCNARTRRQLMAGFLLSPCISQIHSSLAVIPVSTIPALWIVSLKRVLLLFTDFNLLQYSKHESICQRQSARNAFSLKYFLIITVSLSSTLYSTEASCSFSGSHIGSAASYPSRKWCLMPSCL